MKKKVNLLNRRECVSSYVMLEGIWSGARGFLLLLGRFIDKDLGPETGREGGVKKSKRQVQGVVRFQ